MEEAQRLCDRVAIVDHGHLIALGTPAELIAKLEARNVIEFTSEPHSTRPSSKRSTAVPASRRIAAAGCCAFTRSPRPCRN